MLLRSLLVFALVMLIVWAWAPARSAGEDDAAPKAASADGALAVQEGDWASSRRVYDFEEWEFKTETEKLPVGWEKIVTTDTSPEYEQGHAFYNEGFLVEEGEMINLPGAARTLREEMAEVLARPDWERLEVALLRARMALRSPENRYLRLRLYKGCVSFQTREFVPVSQRYSYRLTGRVRARNFTGIRYPLKAWISMLFFTDKRPGSICRHADGTPVIFKTDAITDDTNEQWREVRLLFNRVPHDARYALLRVSAEGSAREAEAEFDDIALVQEPQILVGFDRTPPLFYTDEPVVLNRELAGLPAGAYREKITVEDVSGAVASVVGEDSADFEISTDAEAALRRVSTVAPRGNGVFRVTYDLYWLMDEGLRRAGRAAQRVVIFARASRPIPLMERGRYGATFDFFAAPHPAAADFVRLIGASPVKTPLWSEAIAGAAQSDLAERMISHVRRGSIAVVGVIRPLSESRTIEEGLASTGSAYAFFNQPREKEEALLRFINANTTRYADLLSYLQLGEDVDSSLADTGLFAQAEKKLRSNLVEPLNSSRLVAPISLRSARLPAGDEYLSLYVEASVEPAALSASLAALSGCAERLWVTIEPRRAAAPEDVPMQLADAVRKIVVCRMHGVRAVFLPLVGAGDGLMGLKAFPDETLEVQPLAPAYLNAAAMLEGAVFHGEIRQHDVSALLFRKGSRFVAMLHSPVQGATFTAYWGGDLARYDVLGNPRPLKPIPHSGGTVIEDIGPMPEFIDNIDIGVAETWHSIRLLNPQIRSRVSPQTITLRLKNNFDCPVSGVVRLEFPQELEHLLSKHAAVPFSLKPGEEWDSGDQFQLSPGVSDSLGAKEFEVIADLKVRGEAQQLRKKLTVEIVPDLLLLEVTALTVDDNGELALQVKVTNADKKNVTANLYLTVADRYSRQIGIVGLGAGKEYHVEIRLPFKPDALPGDIWLGLREIGGWQFANIYITKDQIERLRRK